MTLGFSGKEGGNKLLCLFYPWEIKYQQKQHQQQKQQQKQQQNKTRKHLNIFTVLSHGP